MFQPYSAIDQTAVWQHIPSAERRPVMTRLSCRRCVCVGSVSLIQSHTHTQRVDLGRGSEETVHTRVTFTVGQRQVD